MAAALAAAVVASVLFFVAVGLTLKTPAVPPETFVLAVPPFLVRPLDRSQAFLTGTTALQALVAENVQPRGDQRATIVGSVETASFLPSRYMMVPLKGLTYTDGLPHRRFPEQFRAGDARVQLVCERDGRRRELLTVPTLDWFERVFAVPDGWCAGPVRLRAEATAEGVRVGLGTPFRVSALYWLASGPVGAVAAAVVAFGFVSLLVAPFLSLARVPMLPRVTLPLLYLSLAGYAVYLLGQLGLGRATLSVLSVTAAAGPAVAVGIARWRGRASIDRPALALWTGSSWMVGGLVLATYVLLPHHAGPWFPNYAFYPVSWSTDNQLSIMMAKHLIHLGPGHPPYLGSWAVTDRGFAPAGLLTIALTVLRMIGIYDENPIAYEVGHFVQVFFQAMLVPALLLVLQREGWSRRDLRAFAVCVVAAPFVFFNAFYVWPKLLSALLALLAALLAAAGFRERRPLYLSLGVLCLAGALVHHAANVMAGPALIGFLIASLALRRFRLDDMVWMVRRPARAVGLMAAGLVAVALLISHDALEHKTSYGMTFLLTGTGVFGLDGAGIRAAVRRFYAGLSWPALLELKRRQVESLAWVADPFFAGFCSGVPALACARATEFLALLPSLGPAWLVLAARTLRLFPRRRTAAGAGPESEVVRDLRVLAPLCLATILAMIAVFNVPMVTHHIPYAVILGVLLGPMTFVPLLSSAGSRSAILALQIANLVLVWMIGAWWMWHMVIGVD